MGYSDEYTAEKCPSGPVFSYIDHDGPFNCKGGSGSSRASRGRHMVLCLHHDRIDDW